MDQQVVAAELRSIAKKMQDARNCGAADGLKVLLRAHGDDAAKLVRPHWESLHLPLPRCAKWLHGLLPAIRHSRDGCMHTHDGDAFRYEPTYRESKAGVIDCDAQGWRLNENELTEEERLTFYFEQSQLWSDLLLSIADEIGANEPSVIDQQLERIKNPEAKRLFLAMLKFRVSQQQISYEDLFDADEQAFRKPPNGNTKKRLNNLKKSFTLENFDIEAGGNGWRWVKRPDN